MHNKIINHLDLFSGIGGFAKGLIQAGFTINKHYTSEIDKHAKSIYKHRYPDSIDVGDVRHVRADNIERIDAITFGSPCQDFSIAGKRKGMDGERSSLITEAIRLIDECRPKFFIWENVKGTFSSNNGADFWAIIKAFANIGNYRLEWELLNTACYLPQSRERIYLVGTLGDESKKEIFPLRKNFEGASKGSVKAPIVRTLTAGGNSGGLHSSMTILQVADYRKDTGERIRKNGLCPTLCGRAREDGNGQPYIIYQNKKRRLTEIEWERLQGFEDNWTQYGIYDGQEKPVPATQRYKCLGNAVTVDVVQAVGESISRSIYE